MAACSPEAAGWGWSVGRWISRRPQLSQKSEPGMIALLQDGQTVDFIDDLLNDVRDEFLHTDFYRVFSSDCFDPNHNGSNIILSTSSVSGGY